jgi:hypothetical protein
MQPFLSHLKEQEEEEKLRRSNLQQQRGSIMNIRHTDFNKLLFNLLYIINNNDEYFYLLLIIYCCFFIVGSLLLYHKQTRTLSSTIQPNHKLFGQTCNNSNLKMQI